MMMLCNMLFSGDEFTPLSDVQLQPMFRNRIQLIETIDIKHDLLDHMYAKYCITQLQKKAITSVDKLLEIIQRKSVADFNKFLECLSASGQKHILPLLTQDAG